ncbi:hypothetical protein NEMIN01_0263 [Nematocida minor]|uniref:uncharacterized protein n=1 Tax=Nematocida minor TaxID=1912983 RepID=UPI00221E9345|nr:uncharacterized protein NEMIN01_0263 [Nematocida minor]KAI5189097.1 hypothetical protein NEMIN01_0263 [Nematocida minor]
MSIEETLQTADKIIKSGVSEEILMHCGVLLKDENVSCEGLVILLKELSKEIDKAVLE